jgi:uncharacterized membrane protein YphA (DoxX/SURF4 family)
MHLARSSAIYAAPILLRLVLAATFIWAGLGKVVATFPVQGEQAALLANMGYKFPATPRTPDPAPPGEAPPPAEPAPATPPGKGTPETPGAGDQAPPDPLAAAPNPYRLTLASQAAGSKTAADFPDPIEVKRLYGLALLTYSAAHPAPNPDGTTPRPIWPEWAARDQWPIVLAWAAAITELAAGILVLVGLLTRLSALSIASVMAIAMWLTEFGPAIQAGQTVLGFIPQRDPWDTAAWRTLLWQLSLFGAALALALAGPGALAIDRAPHPNDDLDDEDDA